MEILCRNNYHVKPNKAVVLNLYIYIFFIVLKKVLYILFQLVNCIIIVSRKYMLNNDVVIYKIIQNIK